MLIGYHFALRGGKELRDLRFPGHDSQLSLTRDENGEEVLRYKSDLQTKTNQGGLKKRSEPERRKVVYAYGCNLQDRSIINLFRKYVNLCPPSDNGAFWRRSRALHLIEPGCWYTCQPVGRNKLGCTISRLFKMAGIEGKFTNHSLRSGAATTLYRQNVDEQTIKEVTGPFIRRGEGVQEV